MYDKVKQTKKTYRNITVFTPSSHHLIIYMPRARKRSTRKEYKSALLVYLLISLWSTVDQQVFPLHRFKTSLLEKPQLELFYIWYDGTENSVIFVGLYIFHHLLWNISSWKRAFFHSDSHL